MIENPNQSCFFNMADNQFFFRSTPKMGVYNRN